MENAKPEPNKILQVLFYIVFAGYVLLLLYALFFNRSLDEGFRSVNLIPFASIGAYIAGATRGLSLLNVAGNILLFVPLGLYLCALRKDKRWYPNLLIALLCSVAAEAIQWVFAIGATDIDDVMLNTLGALLGILLYKLIARVAKDAAKTKKAVSILSVAVGLPVIALYLVIFLFNLSPMTTRHPPGPPPAAVSAPVQNTRAAAR